jgi:hypothetical protein
VEDLHLNNIKSYLNSILGYFLFVPAVTFGIIYAGVFPYAFFYSINNIKEWMVNKNKYFIYYIFCILFSSFISCIILGRQNNLTQYNLFEIIRSAFSLLNGPIIFATLLCINLKEIRRLKRAVFIIFPIFIAIAIFQFFNFFISNELFRFLIPTADNFNLGSIDRGVTILQSEPARAAYDLIFLAILIKVTLIRRYENFHFLFDIFLLAVILFFNKSMTGLVFTMFFILCFNNLKSIIKLFSLLVICIPLYLFYFEGSRIASFLNFLFFSPESFTRFVYDNSGFRIIGILSVIPEIIRFPFGVSVGLWREHLSLVHITNFPGFIQDSGMAAIKIPSFIFEIIYDFGIFAFYIFHLLIKGAKRIFKVLPLKYLLFFLFAFIFSDTVGDPLPWISLAILYRTFSYASK